MKPLTRLLAALAMGIIPLSAAAAIERPNVVLILADDQGYGDLSCNGNPVVKTPNIDRLAAEGVRFTDFHVAPMCTPTRGQLMTGVDCLRNGAMNVSSGRTLLRPDLPTMADVFRAAGYRTGIFGKWHLGDNYPYRPQDRGFDESLWFPSSHMNSVPDFWDNDYFDDTYWHNGKRERYDGYCTDVYFRDATRWMLESDKTKPFFAYIPTNAPHWPLFVPDRYRGPVREALEQAADKLPELTPARRDEIVSFLAMCEKIDENVGRLDDALRENGLFDNTIVVFLTDNGSTMGEEYYNAGMRGKKVTLWEGGHRVPLFLRWPAGHLRTPGEVAELAQVQDLLPTLADLCGIAAPSKLDGVSLAPLLRDERESLDDRMIVINYSRMPGGIPSYQPDNPAVPRRAGAAVLWKQWRLLEEKELYDVRTDPHQDHNVIDAHPEVAAKMQAHLAEWWEGIAPTVNTPQRVTIGSDAENPMMLTACEWFDVFVDQQRQIRRADRKNGTWHLTVAKAGTYRIELRRWPRESGLKLTDAIGETKVADGAYVEGVALPIHSARITVGDHNRSGAPDDDGSKATFTLELNAGDVELQTAWIDPAGEDICGAYYVYVERL